MPHNQFLRKAELIIGDKEKGIDFSDLHFTFQITQADKENYQAAHIRVYNVSPDTMKKLKTDEYTRVILQAGYQQGNYGLIFDGEIIQARMGRDSPVDTYLDILAGEGYDAQQATMNQTVAAGASDLDTVQAISDTMGKSLKPYDYNPAVKLPRGQALYGMSRDALHVYAATSGYSYYYDKGQLVWVPLEGHKPDEATVVNADTGMIGWPEQTEEGIKVRVLLNPLMDVGGRMLIDNKSIQRAAQNSAYTGFLAFSKIPPVDSDGLYRIYRIEHHGDTRGNDWYSDIVGLAINSGTGMSTLLQRGQM